MAGHESPIQMLSTQGSQLAQNQNQISDTASMSGARLFPSTFRWRPTWGWASSSMDGNGGLGGPLAVGRAAEVLSKGRLWVTRRFSLWEASMR